MIRGHRIICFGDEEWDFTGTIQRMARALAPENELTYITSLGVRRPQLNLRDLAKVGRRLRAWARSSRTPPRANGVRVLTPLGLPLYNTLRGTLLSGWFVYGQLQRQGVFPPAPGTVFWVAIPTAAPIIELLGPVRYFYHAPDYQAAYPGASAAVMDALEEKLARGAAFCVASAENLAARLRRTNPRSFTVDHGVDFDHFGHPPETAPADLQRFPRPIIGYLGGITEWVDQESLCRLVDQRPGWTLVLVGPRHVGMERLLGRPNVHWLGARPYSEVPAYIWSFDVCLLPRKLLEWEIYANPLKILEYFASGKPVVSSALPNVEAYGRLVHIYRSSADIVARVEEALREPVELSGERRELAQAKAHPHEVEELSAYIERYLWEQPPAT